MLLLFIALESLIWEEIILKAKAFQLLGPVWLCGAKERVRCCSWGPWAVQGWLVSGAAGWQCQGQQGEGGRVLGHLPGAAIACWSETATERGQRAMLSRELAAGGFQSPSEAHLIFFPPKKLKRCCFLKVPWLIPLSCFYCLFSFLLFMLFTYGVAAFPNTDE